MACWAAALLVASVLSPHPSSAQPSPEAAPKRVASLNLSADEILVEILPKERLVGVTRFVDDPSTSRAAGRAPEAAYRFAKADIERLVALSPDLVVISEYTDADVVKLIESSGIRSHRMEGLSSIPGVRAAILDLGRAVGEPDRARRLVGRFDALLGELKVRLAGARRPRVLYWSSGLTAGKATAIGSLIETAGGLNLGAEIGVTGIAPPGEERAFAADPDVILVSSYQGAIAEVKNHPLLRSLRAVKEDHVVVMPNALLVALSQYSADACWDLAHRLHPDRVPPDEP